MDHTESDGPPKTPEHERPQGGLFLVVKGTDGPRNKHDPALIWYELRKQSL